FLFRIEVELTRLAGGTLSLILQNCARPQNKENSWKIFTPTMASIQSPISAVSFNKAKRPRRRIPCASLSPALNTRAMAKELHFNHDGSTTKKLLGFIIRQGWNWWQSWLGLLWVLKEGMWCCRISMGLPRLSMMEKLSSNRLNWRIL
ncbi:unnamed protein product, partial [Linum tenue]